MVVADLQERRLRARILGSSHATDRQDAYATLLAPQSYAADAQSSIGFQPVSVVRPRAQVSVAKALLLSGLDLPKIQVLIESYGN